MLGFLVAIPARASPRITTQLLEYCMDGSLPLYLCHLSLQGAHDHLHVLLLLCAGESLWG